MRRWRRSCGPSTTRCCVRLRRVVPLLGGLDLSLLVALILLQIAQLLLGMAFGFR